MIEYGKLRAQLVRHEGYRAFPYRDSVGKLTIGIGRNLDDVGIARAEAELLLDNDLAKAEAGLRERYASWFTALDPVRQAVLINMAFNMGLVTLGTFRTTLNLIASGDYDGAAIAMLQSKWATQVGQRARDLAQQMKTGVWGNL